MSAPRAPWFKFYPADFMAGVRGLSAQEVGLYTMLLARIYEENAPIQYHPLRLAAYCGMREKTFAKTLEKLVALGKITLHEGMLSNRRAEAEISHRANDLENASKAGKASAKKRQQNQAKTATAVQQAFNHTDTDTDTDTDIDDDDRVREPDNFRGMILEAIGLDPAEETALGGPADMAEARGWLELPHVTEERVCEQIRAVMTRKGDRQVHSLAYFTPEMQRMSASLEASKAPLMPATRRKPGIGEAVPMAANSGKVDLDALAALWVPALTQGRPVPSSAISPALARHMLDRNMVTPADLRRAGVSA